MVGFTFASSVLLQLLTALTAPLPTHAEGTRGATTTGSLNFGVGASCYTSSDCPNTNTFFCKMQADGMCDGTEEGGTCDTFGGGAMCAALYEPVCGCDSMIYSSSCDAKYIYGVNVQCTLDPAGLEHGQDTCICATTTSEGAKEMRSSEEETTTSMADCSIPPCHDNRGPPTSGGSSSSHTRQASGSGTPSSEVGSFCDTGSGHEFGFSTPCTSLANFCSVPIGKCDIGEAGTCQAKPTVCTMQYDPVCGCDREIHGNACVANGSGVNVWHEGECEAGNSCSGTQPCTNTEHYFCKMPGGLCGEPLERQWTPHLECAEYGSHISCNSSWQPVCGCDGKVYSNSCSANYQNGVNYLCTLNPDGGALPGEDCDCATMAW